MRQPYRLAIGILCALPAFPQMLGLERILSAPFPDHLTVSPAGDAIAWAIDERGIRNVFVARAPDYGSHAITAFTTDDGQEIGDLAWKPDGSAIVFTRGGANPASDPAGARQEIWVAPIAGEARRIGYGHAPAVAPDGKSVVWIASGQIWSADLEASGPARQLTHELGSASQLNWSPDGSQAAFVSYRVDHALIGLYDAGLKSIRWMDPSVDNDQSPVWSPDGKQIAFIRSPAWVNETGWGQAPRPTGEPWSVRIADVATGTGREVWRSQPGAGSVFWPMNAASQLLWAAGGTIVFPWERDGWLHLYSLKIDLKNAERKAALLTPGFFEVEDVALSSDRVTVLYSSNQGDPDRRHIWSVPVSGGAPDELTPGKGIEWSPAPLKNGAVALLRADAKTPARAAIELNGVVRDLTPSSIPSDFPSAQLVEPQPVLFNAHDGVQLHGQIFLPPNASTGRHPAIVFFHGGPRRQMLLGWHPMQYYNQTYAFNQYLASEGFVVLSVNYRSGIGYGTGFREVLRYGATGGIEYNDVTAAATYLQSRGDVDAARVGAWGGSYGGYLTEMALARASSLFSVGVVLHGIFDWNLEFPTDDPRRSVETKKLAFDSSPIASMESWHSPVLVIQGDDDHNVAFHQSVQLVEALRQHHVPFEQLIFPDEVHDFLLHSNWLKAYRAADDFLAQRLKPELRNKTP